MNEKKLFFISPIGEEESEIRRHFNDVKLIVELCASQLGYEFVSPDLTDGPVDLHTQILENLEKSDIVVADIAFNNPNVFYELTIRMALNKPIVIIQSSKNKIPFDIISLSVISFDWADSDKRASVIEKIKSQINSFKENKQSSNRVAELIKRNQIINNETGKKKIDKEIEELNSKKFLLKNEIKKLEDQKLYLGSIDVNNIISKIESIEKNLDSFDSLKTNSVHYAITDHKLKKLKNLELIKDEDYYRLKQLCNVKYYNKEEFKKVIEDNLKSREEKESILNELLLMCEWGCNFEKKIPVVFSQEFTSLFKNLDIDIIKKFLKTPDEIGEIEKIANKVYIITIDLEKDINDRPIRRAVAENFRREKIYQYILPYKNEITDKIDEFKEKIKAINENYLQQITFHILPEEALNVFEEIAIYEFHDKELKDIYWEGYSLVNLSEDKCVYIRQLDKTVEMFKKQFENYIDMEAVIKKTSHFILDQIPHMMHIKDEEKETLKNLFNAKLKKPFFSTETYKKFIDKIKEIGSTGYIIDTLNNDIKDNYLNF